MSIWELLFWVSLGLCGLIVLLGVWIVWAVGVDASRQRGHWDY
jgi:hypothetical protein